MYLWKSNICHPQLDVQEINVSMPQFYRIRNHFVGCWNANGWMTCSWFVGCSDWSVTFIEQYQNTNQPCSRKLFAESHIQTQTKGKPRCWSIVACGQHHKRKFFSRRVSVVHLWRQWSSDQTMIMKGRSPTVGHVSRTLRGALDWLFDRINLEPEIKIKYVDTKNQHADMLSKGSFTRDELCHLLRLLNIMNSSMFSLQPFSFKLKAECHVQESSWKCFKRRIGSGETETNECGVKELRECEENDPPQDSGDPNSPMDREVDQNCVSSSGRKLTRNINPNTTMYSQEKTTRWHSIFKHEETGADRRTFKLSPRHETGARWGHSNRKVKDGTRQYANLRPPVPRESLQELAEKVESRRRSTNDWYCSKEDQRIDMVIIYVDNDESRHSSWTELHWQFGSIQEHETSTNVRIYSLSRRNWLILDHQAEILSVTTIDWTAPSWARSTLTHDQVITWMTARVRVYSDSVIVLGESVR